MCGISGFFGKPDLSKETRDIAFMKMKILGLYNQQRGVHSCGIYLNGKVYHGIDKVKLFSDYIAEYHFDTPETFPILIHNRQATRGAHTKENCHPFIIGEVSPMVMVHNGTIDNIYQLCAKYKVNTNGVSLDSKLLGMIIYEHGPDVLSEYSGGAALIWTEKDYPGTGFVYHGASRRAKGGDEIEERPLFYMETEEGIYLSSIEDSLWAIARDTEKPEMLDHNTVFKIEDGEFCDRFYEIKRGDSNVIIPSTSSHSSSSHWTRGDYSKDYSDYNRNISITKNVGQTTTVVQKTLKKESLVWRETLPLRSKRKDLLYFHKGRYYCNGELCHGVIKTTNKGVKQPKGGVQHYFWEGVMLVDQNAYSRLCKEKQEGVEWLKDIHQNFAYHISVLSMYPVTNLTSEGGELEDDVRYKWYMRRAAANISFTPKYSSRGYIVKAGYLDDISTSTKKEKTLHASLTEAFNEELRYTVEDDDVVAQAELFKEESNFDKVFDSVEEAMETFSDDESEAMLDYLSDYMSIEEHLDNLSKDELTKELLEKLEYAVKHMVSMRVALGDIFTNTLERYVEAAKNMREEEELDPVGASCGCDIVEEDPLGGPNSLEESIGDAITILKELNDTADEMQELDSDAAQEIAFIIYRKIDEIEMSLKEVFEKFNFPKAKKRLNDELYDGNKI
jgi:Glutamine amidotransferase domain